MTNSIAQGPGRGHDRHAAKAEYYRRLAAAAEHSAIRSVLESIAHHALQVQRCDKRT
jgi:hypothetical protein